MAIDVNGLNISYDYTELIQEIKSDMKEGLFDKYIYIERDYNKSLSELNYKPIVDYYYSEDEIPENVGCDKAYVEDVLEEMEELNSII